LRRAVFGGADTKSRLMADELRAYRRIGQRFAGHDAWITARRNGRASWATARGEFRRKTFYRHKHVFGFVIGVFSLGMDGCVPPRVSNGISDT
jgi:hypothetical protein